MIAKKIDANQGEIVDYLRAAGWSVFVTSAVGNGFPDLVVSRAGFTAVVEVKDGSKPASKRKLTPKEQAFVDNWPGAYVLANNPNEAWIMLETMEAVFSTR